ncbi:MAG: hypothetical protein KIT48_07560 [Pseudolabrys sp.]|nr:hypothetical protein [Pseudolabrys sp.]
MWAGSIWGFFGVAVSLGLAMLSLPDRWLWLQPWFAGAAIVSLLASVAILSWPLFDHEQRAVALVKLEHPIKWIRHLIEPVHIIAIGLLIALAGAVMQWRKETGEPSIASLRSEISALRNQINTTQNYKPAQPAMASPPSDEQRLSPRAVRELLDAMKEAQSMYDEKLLPTISGIAVFSVNWRGEMRNSPAAVAARLEQFGTSLQKDVWAAVDVFINHRKEYRSTLENVFVLDNEAAKNGLGRKISDVTAAVKRFPKESPPEMDELLVRDFKELADQADIAYQWLLEIRKRIPAVKENLEKRGTTGLAANSGR